MVKIINTKYCKLWKLKLPLEKCHSGQCVGEGLGGGGDCSIVRCQKHKSISKRCMTRQMSNLLTF